MEAQREGGDWREEVDRKYMWQELIGQLKNLGASSGPSNPLASLLQARETIDFLASVLPEETLWLQEEHGPLQAALVDTVRTYMEVEKDTFNLCHAVRLQASLAVLLTAGASRGWERCRLEGSEEREESEMDVESEKKCQVARAGAEMGSKSINFDMNKPVFELEHSNVNEPVAAVHLADAADLSGPKFSGSLGGLGKHLAGYLISHLRVSFGTSNVPQGAIPGEIDMQAPEVTAQILESLDEIDKATEGLTPGMLERVAGCLASPSPAVRRLGGSLLASASLRRVGRLGRGTTGAGAYTAQEGSEGPRAVDQKDLAAAASPFLTRAREMVEDPSPAVRAGALTGVAALASAGVPLPRAAFRAAVAVLEDKYEEVRLAAVRLVGLFGLEGTVEASPGKRTGLDPALVDEAFLQDSDAPLRSAARTLLAASCAPSMAALKACIAALLKSLLRFPQVDHFKLSLPGSLQPIAQVLQLPGKRGVGAQKDEGEALEAVADLAAAHSASVAAMAPDLLLQVGHEGACMMGMVYAWLEWRDDMSVIARKQASNAQVQSLRAKEAYLEDPQYAALLCLLLSSAATCPALAPRLPRELLEHLLLVSHKFARGEALLAQVRALAGLAGWEVGASDPPHEGEGEGEGVAAALHVVEELARSARAAGTLARRGRLREAREALACCRDELRIIADVEPACAASAHLACLLARCQSVLLALQQTFSSHTSRPGSRQTPLRDGPRECHVAAGEPGLLHKLVSARCVQLETYTWHMQSLFSPLSKEQLWQLEEIRLAGSLFLAAASLPPGSSGLPTSTKAAAGEKQLAPTKPLAGTLPPGTARTFGECTEVGGLESALHRLVEAHADTCPHPECPCKRQQSEVSLDDKTIVEAAQASTVKLPVENPSHPLEFFPGLPAGVEVGICVHNAELAGQLWLEIQLPPSDGGSDAYGVIYRALSDCSEAPSSLDSASHLTEDSGVASAACRAAGESSPPAATSSCSSVPSSSGPSSSSTRHLSTTVELWQLPPAPACRIQVAVVMDTCQRRGSSGSALPTDGQLAAPSASQPVHFVMAKAQSSPAGLLAAKRLKRSQ
eukprot:jgi/Mesen1/8229/ME000443S07377